MRIARIAGVTLLIMALGWSCAFAGSRTVTDGTDRQVTVPEKVTKVLCSGSGCLRLLTYLQSADLVVGVDDAETRARLRDARPYAITHPEFKKMPVFGQFRGFDRPELIFALPEMPQVIFKTYPAMGHDPQELQSKTGIPVVTLQYGDLGKNRNQFYASLRHMGDVLGKEKRAEEVISFFEATIADLKKRTAGFADTAKPSVYVGGIAYKGPHGFQSTEPSYPPFGFLGLKSVADNMGGKAGRHADVAKEKILEWNPEYLFVDLSTLQLGDGGGALGELQTDPAYRILTAVQNGKVYGLLPYNWYTSNYGSVLVDAYIIGKIVYPEAFADVDISAKAEEIYTFLVGGPVYDKLNKAFSSYAGKALPVN